MTLQDFFILISKNPSFLLFFFIAIPMTALLAGIFGKGDGHLPPWRYLYGILIYSICIPGIFSFFFNVYLFLFERQSIFAMDIYTQIIPIISMLITLFIIGRNVDYDDIPGFEKISGLVTIISVLLAFLWIIDRTHIYVISLMPFYWVIIIFVAMIFIVRLGFKKLVN